jgi:hypothetical protein
LSEANDRMKASEEALSEARGRRFFGLKPSDYLIKK